MIGLESAFRPGFVTFLEKVTKHDRTANVQRPINPDSSHRAAVVGQ
jgi:hypothetical protein